MVCAGVIALALPMLVGAAPPAERSAFDDLPDPAVLEDREAVEAAERRTEPEPSERDSADELVSGEHVEEDETAVEEDEQVEDAAVEPAQPKIAAKVLKDAKWIKHEVVPGEMLDDIAERYQVKRASLIRWNKLDKDKPRIYAGRELSVYTKFIPPPKQKITYTVVYGDTWNKIADAHGVDVEDLRITWNPKVPRKFKAGQEIVIWLDPMTGAGGAGGHFDEVGEAVGEVAKASAGTSAIAVKALPLVKIPRGSISVGQPNRGKLANSAALPENDKLYTVRKPEEAYGSSHTLHNLQLAIANWRQDTGFDRPLIIGAISKKGGGRLRPHSSHQSGRDVDIRLPTKKGIPASKIPESASEIDWDASWGLIAALVATGEIQYIFLSSSRQKHLYQAAKRAGASKDLLERVIQYPERPKSGDAIVRHAKGHEAHIHVRFNCAPNETKCESY